MEDEFMCRALAVLLQVMMKSLEKLKRSKSGRNSKLWEVKWNNDQGFLNTMLLLLWREVVTSDSAVILDTKIQILLAILVAV